MSHWYEIHAPGYSVRVIADVDVDLDVREEQIVACARLAVAGVRRERAIAACPGHKWELEFDAVYLDGAKDALCRCGARRSDITPA